MAALGVTSLAPSILLSVPVHRYRKNPGQVTRQASHGRFRTATAADTALSPAKDS